MKDRILVLQDFFERNTGRPLMIYQGDYSSGYSMYAGDETVQMTTIRNNELRVKVKESEDINIFEEKLISNLEINEERVRVTFYGYENRYVEYHSRAMYK